MRARPQKHEVSKMLISQMHYKKFGPKQAVDVEFLPQTVLVGRLKVVVFMGLIAWGEE